MPGKVHDWSHVFWRNGSGDRVFVGEQEFGSEEEIPEEAFEEAGFSLEGWELSVFMNDRGETVSYGYVLREEVENEEGEIEEGPAYAPRGVSEGEGSKYAVTLNGTLVENVELEIGGESVYFDALTFDTRRDAREAATAFRRLLPPIDEEKLEEMEYDELVELGKPRGFSQNDGRETIVAGLTG